MTAYVLRGRPVLTARRWQSEATEAAYVCDRGLRRGPFSPHRRFGGWGARRALVFGRGSIAHPKAPAHPSKMKGAAHRSCHNFWHRPLRSVSREIAVWASCFGQ